MNVYPTSHAAEEVLERYAMGRISPQDCAALEEHLLLCANCQDRLGAVAEYIRVVKAAVRRRRMLGQTVSAEGCWEPESLVCS